MLKVVHQPTMETPFRSPTLQLKQNFLLLAKLAHLARDLQLLGGSPFSSNKWFLTNISTLQTTKVKEQDCKCIHALRSITLTSLGHFHVIYNITLYLDMGLNT